MVDPDTYVLETYDAVVVPGVERARLQYVNEALDTKKRNKTLRQKLSEELDKASDEDRKIMEESLKRLDIKLNEDTITVNEKLVEPTEEEINQIKSDLSEIGFDVDKEGETLFGAHHLQLVLRGDGHDAETLHRVANELSDLADKYQDFAVTYNVGLTDKYEITCGLDIRDKHVDEELKDEDG
jgi:citrate lyase beta subunit